MASSASRNRVTGFLLQAVKVGLIVLTVLIVLLLLAAYFEVICSQNLIASRTSPDGQHRVFVYTTICPTLPIVTKVSIEGADVTKPRGGPANVFAATGGREVAVITEQGGVGIGVKWLEQSRLGVRYDRNAMIRVKRERVDDYVINYEAVPFKVLQDEGLATPLYTTGPLSVDPVMSEPE